MKWKGFPMRHAFLAPVLVALASTVPANQAGADAAGAAREAIQAQYRKINAAIEKQDADAIVRFLAPDFRLTGGGDSVNRAEYKAIVRQGFQTTHDLKASTTIESFKLSGNRAVAVTTQIQNGKARLPNDPKDHAVTVVMKIRDTWTKTAKGWLLQRSEGLSTRSTVDGKQSPTAPGDVAQ
jgi:ketosteroid isomerase-like protein